MGSSMAGRAYREQGLKRSKTKEHSREGPRTSSKGAALVGQGRLSPRAGSNDCG